MLGCQEGGSGIRVCCSNGAGVVDVAREAGMGVEEEVGEGGLSGRALLFAVTVSLPVLRFLGTGPSMAKALMMERYICLRRVSVFQVPLSQ